MRYSHKYIIDNRYAKDRTKVRKMEERYVVMSAITKFLSPPPTYVFLNLGLHPDAITLASFVFIIIGSWFFVIGYPIYGMICYLVFALFDSVDGDMARCKGPTLYGSILDSFGADLFYAFSPVSIAYYLFTKNISIWIIEPRILLLIGAFVSLTFILYRLINAKVFSFLNKQPKENKENHAEIAKEKIKYSLLKKFFALYRHTVVRGNFFSEAGMLFWFSIFVFLGEYNILAWYLVILLVYNTGYLMTNFIGTYIYFRSMRKINI